MKITILTSDPERVLGKRGLVSSDTTLKIHYDVFPEIRWLHPTARLEGMVKLIKKGYDLSVVTWDELTMLVAMAASREKVADVEVLYYTVDGDEPVAIKMTDGTLSSWPDRTGFFTQRRKALFDGPLFGD